MIEPSNIPYTIEGLYWWAASQMSKAPRIEEPPHQMTHLRTDPNWVTRELRNVVFDYSIPDRIDKLANEVKPNLPWADEHFEERVSGIPHNPPPSHEHWPYAQAGNEEHLLDGKFSHTYPERMWPNAIANEGYMPTPVERRGIRFDYGDLDDLLALLVDHPHTRQAYLPIWFPEDLTAAKQGERVPCTLGYHFLMRENRLNLFYPIRSCDLVRFFRDDVYMACRLVQWVLEQVQPLSSNRVKPDNWAEKYEDPWESVKPGTLTMHIVSLHCFEGDLANLRRQHEAART